MYNDDSIRKLFTESGAKRFSLVTRASRLMLLLPWKRKVKRVLQFAVCKHCWYQLCYETHMYTKSPLTVQKGLYFAFLCIQLTLCNWFAIPE